MTAMFLGGLVSFGTWRRDFCIIISGLLLDDDVVRTADDSETLALDDTGTAAADEGLVGLYGNAERAGLVTGAVN